MKITEDVRKYAEEQRVAESEVLRKGMQQKAEEFVAKGGEVYSKGWPPAQITIHAALSPTSR